MKLHVELWKSDNNQEEIHLFLPGERNTYVLGFNPKQLPIAEVEQFLIRYGLEFDVMEKLT